MQVVKSSRLPHRPRCPVQEAEHEPLQLKAAAQPKAAAVSISHASFAFSSGAARLTACTLTPTCQLFCGL